nr:hypothetical protein [Tanacetum cinerariifolium]
RSLKMISFEVTVVVSGETLDFTRPVIRLLHHTHLP